MKKFIIKNIILFLPVLFLVIAVNYFADPANIFSDRYVKKIVYYLKDYKYVNNIANYDDRRFLEYYFNSHKGEKYNYILLGSSRSMEIGAELFGNNTLFNSSVSGAVINDYISIYELLKADNIQYDSVVIGSDPWIFNKNENSKRYRSLIDYYAKSDPDVNLMKIHFFQIKDKAAEIISLSYLQESLHYMIKVINNGVFPGNDKTTFQSIRNDGRHFYSEQFINIDPNEKIINVKKYAERKDLYSLKNYRKLDKELVEKYLSVIDSMIKNGKRVIIFLPPYHPEAYKIMAGREDARIIIDAEKLIRSIASQRNITVVGSYDPVKYNLKDDDFYDAMHPKDKAVEKMFRSDLIFK